MIQINDAPSSGAAAAFNADANNRQLHPTERQTASNLVAKSGGKYTQQQIEDAMRNAANATYGETATTGVVVDASLKPFDPEAKFTAPAANGTAAQILPNGGSVDPQLAAFIQANTGGSGSAYSWTDVQLGKIQAPATDPNASIKMTVDPSWNYMGSSSAGMGSGVMTDNRTQAEIDKSLNDTTKAIAILPAAIGATVIAPEAAAIGGGINLGAQIIKGDGVSPTEALVSTTMGPVGAVATETQAIKAVIEQGGKAAIGVNAGVGAATNVMGDTTTKVLKGDDVTAGEVVKGFAAGSIGGSFKNPVVQSIVTEGLNAVPANSKNEGK